MTNGRRSGFKPVSLVVLTASLLALVAGVTSSRVLAGAKAPRVEKATGPTGTECRKDAECVVVPVECCPCSAGGKQRAIPERKRAAYEKDQKKRCAGTFCAEMISQDPSCADVPLCRDGRCTLAPPPPPR